MRSLLLVLSGVFLFASARAQDSWSLQRCVEYARDHNIQIKQQELQARLSRLTLQQSKLSQIPSLNGSGSYGFNFGRSVDPTSYEFTNTQFNSLNLGLNSNVTLFNWFQKRNTIEANKYAAYAQDATLKKMVNDISLNVATAFLQILQAQEQLKVSEEQVKLTTHQLDNTIKQVDAGALPESNRADLEAQLARDSSDLIVARNSVTSTILQMKALLNLDFETSFVPEVPENIDNIPVIDLMSTGPQQIYELALTNQPQLLADSFQVQSSRKQLAATKAGLYPSISLYAGLSTNYASTYQRLVGQQSIVVPPYPIGNVTVNDKDYTVNSLESQQLIPVYQKPSFGGQINDNLNENIGISLNIPLFNGWQARSAVRRAQIDLENQQLVREQDQLQLKQDVYQAFADAKAALEKFHASQKTLASSQTAFFYASKRYDLGLINSVDYLTSQNNLYKAQTDLLSSHYEYIFKSKVLEFYRDLQIQF